MSVATSRADFESLIDLRLAEAEALMDHLQDWDGAFYLARYAVEFAIKVYLIAHFIKPDRFPEKRLTDSFYKHDLTELAALAGLKDALKKRPCGQQRLGTRPGMERAEPLPGRQDGAGSQEPLSSHQPEGAAMDQSSLVADEVADGRRLLERFVADGNAVTAAAWITAEGSETPFLHIATGLYDLQGPRDAYHAVGASLDSIADSLTSLPDVRLISPGNPIARAIAGLAKSDSKQVGFPMRAQQIGPLGEARLYIYNPWVYAATPPGSMTPDDVGRAVFRLLQRGSGPQPTSRVTLKDGTGFEGRPLALFAGDVDSMRVQFVESPDLAVRDLKLGEIAAIR